MRGVNTDRRVILLLKCQDKSRCGNTILADKATIYFNILYHRLKLNVNYSVQDMWKVFCYYLCKLRNNPLRQILSQVFTRTHKIIQGWILSLEQTFSKCYTKYTSIIVIFLLLDIDNINLYLFFVNIFCNETICLSWNYLLLAHIVLL